MAARAGASEAAAGPVTISYDVVGRLLAALGLDGKWVTRLTLDVDAGRCVSLRVESLPDGDAVKRLCEVFELHPLRQVPVEMRLTTAERDELAAKSEFTAHRVPPTAGVPDAAPLKMGDWVKRKDGSGEPMKVVALHGDGTLDGRWLRLNRLNRAGAGLPGFTEVTETVPAAELALIRPGAPDAAP